MHCHSLSGQRRVRGRATNRAPVHFPSKRGPYSEPSRSVSACSSKNLGVELIDNLAGGQRGGHAFEAVDLAGVLVEDGLEVRALCERSHGDQLLVKETEPYTTNAGDVAAGGQRNEVTVIRGKISLEHG